MLIAEVPLVMDVVAYDSKSHVGWHLQRMGGERRRSSGVRKRRIHVACCSVAWNATWHLACLRQVTYAPGFADASVCAAVSAEARPLSVGGRYDPHPEETRLALSTAQHLAYALERSDDVRREVIVPLDDPSQLGCFVQTVNSTQAARDAQVQRVLVLKVASFSPPGQYLDAWAAFLRSAEKCLQQDFEMVVVDVMQNGGGYVCLGLRLLELLVEDFFDDHTKVQMRYDLAHSELMDAYIKARNAPDPYPDPEAVEQILNPATQESFADGQAWYYPGRNVTQGGVTNWRSNVFALDCRAAEALPRDFRPAKFVPADRLVILTDGTCGSTCASFTKIAQEAEKATFVGAGGIWGESIDVSSFAGGFVCNPDYLSYIANASGLSFPKFLTNQAWQFGWATWYSAKLPSRPVQFTVQDPAYRTPFWAFPHPSVSANITAGRIAQLYDGIIDDAIRRIAAANGNGAPALAANNLPFWVAIAVESAVILLAGLGIGCRLARPRSNGGTSLKSPLMDPDNRGP